MSERHVSDSILDFIEDFEDGLLEEEVIVLSRTETHKIKMAIEQQFRCIWDGEKSRDKEEFYKLQGMIEIATKLEIPNYEIYDIINKIVLNDDDGKIRAWKNLCRYVDAGFYKPISIVWLKYVGKIIEGTTIGKDAKESRMQVFSSVVKYTLADDIIPFNESWEYSRKADNTYVGDFDFEKMV